MSQTDPVANTWPPAGYSSSAASVAKYQKFVTARFGNAATLRAASHSVFNQDSDVAFDSLRGGLWLLNSAVPIVIAMEAHPELFAGVCDAMTDVVLNRPLPNGISPLRIFQLLF